MPLSVIAAPGGSETRSGPTLTCLQPTRERTSRMASASGAALLSWSCQSGCTVMSKAPSDRSETSRACLKTSTKEASGACSTPSRFSREIWLSGRYRLITASTRSTSVKAASIAVCAMPSSSCSTVIVTEAPSAFDRRETRRRPPDGPHPVIQTAQLPTMEPRKRRRVRVGRGNGLIKQAGIVSCAAAGMKRKIRRPGRRRCGRRGRRFRSRFPAR